MGKAARWFKALLTGRKPAKEKKRWAFAKSVRERDQKPPMKTNHNELAAPAAAEDEEDKRAIAAATATAAAAKAAVAAAQAAATVVQLTSGGRIAGGLKREILAAVEIQKAFRGYLARRAMRALKGLVKLQALVRGNIVRKQTAETLRCMHALIRVQARARAGRALSSEKGRPQKGGTSGGSTNSRLHPGPATPEKFETSSRLNSLRSDRTPILRRYPSKQANPDYWLNQWMDERYPGMEDDRSTEILEIDSGKQHLSARRRVANQIYSSCSALASNQNSRNFTTLACSPSSVTLVGNQRSLSPARYCDDEAGDYDDSLQFYTAYSRPGSSRRAAFTPSKSECSQSLISEYSDYPNYMANTESSRAKVRSHSAPKQRPEFEKLGSVKRLFVHQELGQDSSAVSATRSFSPHSKLTHRVYPGSGRLDRLGMPVRY